jgi:DNA-binding MarR family transcriptional regulator
LTVDAERAVTRQIVLYPGEDRYRFDAKTEVMPFTALLSELGNESGPHSFAESRKQKATMIAVRTSHPFPLAKVIGNDAEAVDRHNMRFIPIKTDETGRVSQDAGVDRLRHSLPTSVLHLHVTCTGKLYTCYSSSMIKHASVSEIETASALAAQLRTTLSRLKHHLREHGRRGDLTPSQISVILHLEAHGATTVSGLARSEGMRPQSMSAIVTALQDVGLVASSSDPKDGRQTLMALSGKCEKWLREGRAARQDWLTSAILQKLSAQQQKTLSVAVGLLGRLMEDGPLS